MVHRKLRIPLLAAVAAALTTGAALAQTQTPAGTQIQNQASATYTDSGGNPQVATSGLAITVVQQVYTVQVKPDNGNAPTASSNFALNADPSNTKSGVAGSSVNFAYTVSNPGNGTDSFNLAVVQAAGASDNFDFTGVAIYQDTNNNGLRDAGEPQITSAISIPGGGNLSVVVVATVPSSGVTAGNTALLDLTASSVGGGASVLDNNNLGKLTVINDASLSLSKIASGPDASGVITYTLSGSNAGSQPAKSVINVDGQTDDGILISDPIPSGTTLVISPAPTGSSGGTGTTSVVYFVSGAWTTTASASATKIGLLIRDANPTTDTSENTLAVAANYQLQFKVQIITGVGAPAGGSDIPNTATIAYNPQAGGPATTTSNTTHTTVPSTISSKIGPLGQPTGAASGSYNYALGANTITITRSGDGDLVPSTDAQAATGSQGIAAGTTITFQNTVRNAGNVSDTILVTVDAASVLPSGYSVQLFQTDGVTPLSSAIALAGNTDYTLVVKVNIPGTAAISSGATVVLKSTSQTDTTKTDLTRDSLVVTVAAAVQFGNTTPALGVDSNPVNRAANPGQPAVYALDVVNNGGAADSFNLTGSVTVNLVGGGTTSVPVIYYPASADVNNDGTLSAAEIGAASPISNTGTIAGGAERKVFGVVTVPASAAAGTFTVNQSVTSPTTNATASFNADTLTVNTINGLTLSPNGSGTTTSPGTLIYQHTLTNTGNSTVNVSLTPGSGNASFTYLIYRDVNGNGGVDAGDTVLYNGSASPVSVTAGQSIPVLVQVTTVTGLTSGTIDGRVITATDGTANATVTDTTTIVAGELQLTKTATLINDANSDGRVEPRTYLSGQGLPLNRSEIGYTIRAKNVGTAPLSNVVILDPIPNFTDFKNDITSGFTTAAVEVTCAAGLTCTVEYSNDGGSTWTHTPAAGYVSSVTNIRVVVSGGTLSAGAEITIKFVVSVR